MLPICPWSARAPDPLAHLPPPPPIAVQDQVTLVAVTIVAVVAVAVVKCSALAALVAVQKQRKKLFQTHMHRRGRGILACLGARRVGSLVGVVDGAGFTGEGGFPGSDVYVL